MAQLSLDAGLPFPALTTGSLVKHAFGVWTRNLFGFSFIGLVVYAPIMAFWISPRWIPSLYEPLYGREAFLAAPIAFVLTSLAAEIATGAVTYGVVEQLAGRRASVGAMLSMAVRRGPTVLLVAIATFAATIGGFVLLVVPGVILSLMLAVSVPAAMIERSGVRASLRRSRDLTLDHRGKIFVLMFVVNMVGRFASQLAGGAAASFENVAPLAAFLVVHVTVAIVLSLQAVAAAVAYHDLRLAKEGTDTDELARVFE